ncbi:MAG: class II fructose-1,6-bisphosphate aldolase [bacterium]|nr:class II fructose-1,6-bisphosphate aldolase [bacterium]
MTTTMQQNTTIHYSELGFVNTTDMFKKANEGGYAIGAFNFSNLEQLQGVLNGCIESNAPVILQLSKGACNYADPIFLRNMARGAIEYVRSQGSQIPIALHLDHGDTFETCKSCIDNGFSSVMIDASHYDFEENIRITKEVVEYAHKFNVTVEAELGVLAGIEDDVVAAKSVYTNPDEVEEFVKRTNVDSLAISIGTSHGATKFKPEQCTRNADGVLEPPELRFDILEEVERRLPGFPIVLHGSSSVIPKYITIIEENGGRIENAVGCSEVQLRRTATSAVCKMNIDSDCRLAMTAAVRKVLKENPGEFDPRKFMGPAREWLKEVVIHKNTNVLGSAGKG